MRKLIQSSLDLDRDKRIYDRRLSFLLCGLLQKTEAMGIAKMKLKKQCIDNLAVIVDFVTVISQNPKKLPSDIDLVNAINNLPENYRNIILSVMRVNEVSELPGLLSNGGRG